MHHAVGIFGLIVAITFVFGARTARAVVGAGLILGLIALLYVVVLVVMDKI